MSNVNKKGFGTPFVVLYDAAKKELAVNDASARSFITQFKYTAKEKDDDECIINLWVKDIQSLDQLDIQYRTRLFVKWGYLNGINSGFIEVMVKSFKRRYSPQGIFYIITCADIVSQLKYFKDIASERTTLLDYILKVTAGRYTVKIQHQGKLIFYKPLRVRELAPGDIPMEEAQKVLSEEDYVRSLTSIYSNDEAYWRQLSDKERTSKALEILRQKISIWEHQIEELTDENIPFEKRDIGLINDIRAEILTGRFEESILEKKLEEYEHLPEIRELNSIFGRYLSSKLFDIVPFSSSPYQIIEAYLKGAPDGPWYLDGTGDTLTIHNRFLEKNPSFYYIYQGEPGDLLEFTPEMKFKPNRNNNFLRTTKLDEKKGFSNMYHYLHVLKNLRPLREILDDQTMGDNLKEEEIRAWYLAYLAHDKYGIFQRVESLKKYPQGERPEIDPKDWAGIDNKFLNAMDLHRIYIRREEDPNSERDSVSNKQRETDMEKSKATIKILGNPLIANRETLTVFGLSSRDSGNYYVQEITHSLGSGMGYQCTGKLIKAIPFSGITSVIEPVKVDKKGNIIKENYSKRYEREQKIFKSGVIFEKPTGKYDYDNTRVVSGPAASLKLVDEYETINAIDLLGSQARPLSENVKILLKDYKRGTFKQNAENY